MNSRLRIPPLLDRRSIQYPLAKIIVIAFLIGTGLIFLSEATLTLNNVRKEIHRTLTSAANAAATTANAAVAFHDAKAAHDILQMFTVYPEIEAAALYSQDGMRLAGYGNPHALPTHVIDNAAGTGFTANDIAPMAETATLYQPITVNGTPIGSIGLRAQLGTYWHNYLSAIASSVMIIAIAGLVALFFSIRFLNRIIRPVHLLAEAANTARLHQVFSPCDISSENNEIGTMIHNFNALLAEVETSRTSLLKHQSELEKQISDRTQALLTAKISADDANNEKSRFLAAASHDLRQPIHAMRLFIDTLRNTPLNPEQQRIAHFLSLSARNLADIINTLLDISRLDSGMVKPHPASIPVFDVFRKIESEFAAIALEKELRFKLFLPAQELRLFTDHNLLYCLLRNLIDNAIKYTRTGGILVAVRKRQASALIQVWDTGIGIPAAHLEGIFDEYFQIGNPQRDSTQGLGLGLSIVKRMAKLLNLQVHCRSTPGKGSLFEISLPLADQSASAAQAAVEIAGPVTFFPASLTGRHVAIIEDDKIVTAALTLGLESYGMKVSQFPSAEQALESPHIESADYYVSDYRLPGLNGVQLLDEIQKRVKRPIKATLLTGETYQQEQKIAASARWTVLFKPIDLATLITVFEAQSVPSLVQPDKSAHSLDTEPHQDVR